MVSVNEVRHETLCWFGIVLIRTMKGIARAQRNGWINAPLLDYQEGKLIGLCYALRAGGVLNQSQMSDLCDLVAEGVF